jgi:peptide/nickel transport system substrate-binding protein
MKRRIWLAALTAVTAGSMLSAPAALAADGEKVLRVVPHANLSAFDPIITTAYIVRNYGYMVYDTLFSQDSKGEVKPQMVDTYSVSADGKTWTFKLRAGLKFHDGNPVEADDVIASLKRWSQKDAMGGQLATFIERYEGSGDTFKLVLKEPCGFVLDALGKPSSNVPFIMPASVAATSANEAITSKIGSGPLIFKEDEFKSGDLAVFVKNKDYVSRKEAPDGMAGGRQINFDRVEWKIIRDAQTQFNALKAGEVDVIEALSHSQYDEANKTDGVHTQIFAEGGLSYFLRFNHTLPPFDKAEIRRAAMVALGQRAALRAQAIPDSLGQVCPSFYPCGTPYASKQTGYFTGKPNPKKAKEMLAAAKYDGTPVVLMQPTNVGVLAKVPLVAKQQLEQAGFKVDLQAMDWGTLIARRAKKDPVTDGGWNIFISAWHAADIQNPLSVAMYNPNWFGWYKSDKMSDALGKFARASDAALKKQLAQTIQDIAIEDASWAPMGQFVMPAALRNDLTPLVATPGIMVPWGIKRK